MARSAAARNLELSLPSAVPSQRAPAENRADTGSGLIDKVVHQLNQIGKRATLEFAMSVGKLIVDNFYRGNLRAWRERGTKCFSFRRLAAHPDLPISPASLYRAVAMYELTCRLGIDTWNHVSTSHMRLVLSLPEDVQAQLLARAEDERWTTERLGEEAATLPIERKRRGGRRKIAPLQRTIRTLARCLDESDSIVGTDDAGLSFPAESIHSTLDLIKRVRDALTVLESRIQVAEPGKPRR